MILFQKSCNFAAFQKYITMTSYIEFHDKLQPQGCFSINQARFLFPTFDRNNITRWTKRGLLIKLRQEWYAFPEMLQRPDFARYVANRIYCPSYISLHTALSIYGMIPEAVTSITSISTLKTASFSNAFGNYTYQNVKPTIFFGYKPILLPEGNATIKPTKIAWYLAHPEKALLDLLYLYPFYDNEAELEALRLDDYFMANELDQNRMQEYLTKMNNKALNKRVKLLMKIHGL